MGKGTVEVHRKNAEPWRVTLVDTGEDTMTGGRLKRVREFLGNEPFCCTYGDGVADVRIDELLAFHKKHGKLATVTAIQPPGRFGALDLEAGAVKSFQEKPRGDGAWINGGFFVFDPAVIDRYIKDDSTLLEVTTMQALTGEKQLQAFQHKGFWQAMDTMRDKILLEEAWRKGNAPWKVWA
jgi:glucose-1-phosphate cytidylyltransferase